MSSISVQPRGIPPRPLTSSQRSLPQVSVPQENPVSSTSSPTLDQQQRKLKTQQQRDLTSVQTQQDIEQTIDNGSPPHMMERAQQLGQVLGNHPLTQGLSTTTGYVVEKGSQLYDTQKKVEKLAGDHLPEDVTQTLESLVESLGEKVEISENFKLDTAETLILSRLTGVSGDNIGSAKQALGLAQQVLQTTKTLQCMKNAYDSYGTDQFQTRLGELAESGYETLGGKANQELAGKISKFCQTCDLDSGKEMMEALAKFSTDDSLIPTLERNTLSYLTKGNTLAGVVGKSVPFLSYGSAAIDTGIMLKTGYDWYNGKTSNTEMLKSTLTATGSILGATVAPVVGPLVTSGVNYGIDTLSNWWYG